MDQQAQTLNQIDALLAGVVIPSFANYVNYGVISSDDYNAFIDMYDETTIPEDVFIKFIEDELPEEIPAPNLVAFYLTTTGHVIVEANYEYLVGVLYSINPLTFNNQDDVVNTLEDIYENEQEEIDGVTIYLNSLAERVEDGHIFQTYLNFNNSTDDHNIILEDGNQYPSFPIAFSKLYMFLSHPDLRIKAADGSWLVVDSEMTPNKFAENLVLTPGGEAFTLEVAIR